MGSRKRISNEKRREITKQKVSASLNNYPSSPRKMRLVAGLIREKDVDKALHILEFSKKSASKPVKYLLLSALDNWKKKNQEGQTDQLYIKEIKVDYAGALKRVRPAPQGRRNIIRKRSNHLSIEIANRNQA